MSRFPCESLIACLLLGCTPAASPEGGPPKPSVEAPSPAPSQAYRKEVVVAGSPFQGVHGLVLDGRGHLLASNLLGQTVHSVDLQSGEVSTLVGPPLGGADDVDVGPDGSVYWTGYLTGQLMRRTPDGDVGVLAKDLPGCNSLAFRRDGRLYFTQLGHGDALWEIEPGKDEAPRLVLDGPGFLNGFEFGPDDKLYGPILLRGQVVRIDVDTKAVEVVADGFTMPTAVNFDARRENLYVVDAARGELVRVHAKTGEKTVVAQLPSGLDNLTLGPDDQVYVSNMVDNDIRVVNPADGSVRVLVEGRLSVPSGLAVAPDDADERLYVADVFALRRVGGRDGALAETTRVLSTRMIFPMHVSLSAKHVVLTSAFVASVQVLDRASGEVLRTIPNTNGVQGAIELPDGALLVAEAGTGRLVRVDDGEPPNTTVLAEGLEGPVGLLADTEAEEPGVYVTEVRAGRVTRVRLSDGSKQTLTSDLRAPEGIARHPDGPLIVAEVGRKRLLRVDPATGSATVLASDLPIGLPEGEGMPPGYVPTGVAVGRSGTIYVASDVESALYRFVPVP